MTGVHRLAWHRSAFIHLEKNKQMSTFTGDGVVVFLVLFCLKRRDEVRGRRSGRERGKGKSTVRMRGVIEHNRDTGGPLSWRDSGEDEATYLMVTSGKWGPITTRNANAKLWAPGTGPAPQTRGEEACQGACMTASIHTHKCKEIITV